MLFVRVGLVKHFPCLGTNTSNGLGEMAVVAGVSLTPVLSVVTMSVVVVAVVVPLVDVVELVVLVWG